MAWLKMGYLIKIELCNVVYPIFNSLLGKYVGTLQVKKNHKMALLKQQSINWQEVGKSAFMNSCSAQPEGKDEGLQIICNTYTL